MKMEFKGLTMDQLFLSAVKSEIEASDIYAKAAEKAETEYLRDRLKFLSKEETMHAKMLKKMFKETFPGRKLDLDEDLPEDTPVPLPELKPIDSYSRIENVLKDAMAAEKAASRFYEEMSKKVDNPNAKFMFAYFSKMETTHFNLLKTEFEVLTNGGDE